MHAAALRRSQPRPGQRVALHAPPQLELADLARRGVRDVVHHHHVIRDPPTSNLALEKGKQLLAGGRLHAQPSPHVAGLQRSGVMKQGQGGARSALHLALLGYDDQQGALSPLFVRHCNDGSLRDLRGMVWDVKGGLDPALAASRLDY